MVSDCTAHPRPVSYELFRSDNCVKNHFYSRLRKSLRKLNKVIVEQFCKDYRQIKIDLLYKII